ncbi:MAG: hypothetical protein NVSMB66_6540 [Candidatus Doudnabacteria bacterium]
MATAGELVRQLEKLEAAGKRLEDYNPEEFRDRTRSLIAKVFVFGFFIILLLTIFSTMGYNWMIFHQCKVSEEFCRNQLLSVKDMVVEVIGFVGSPLGFVLGYYFKAKEI